MLGRGDLIKLKMVLSFFGIIFWFMNFCDVIFSRVISCEFCGMCYLI